MGQAKNHRRRQTIWYENVDWYKKEKNANDRSIEKCPQLEIVDDLNKRKKVL